MNRSFFPRVLSFFSAVLLVFSVLTTPLALVEALSGAFSLNVAFPLIQDLWAERMGSFSSVFPILAYIPAWVINILYLLMIVAVLAWYYFVSINLEARRQFEMATEGDLGEIEPLEDDPDALTNTAGALAGAGLVTGGIAGKSAMAAAFAGTGPPGWALAAGWAGLVGVWYLVSRSDRRKAKAAEHARREAARLAERRLEIASINVETYKRRQRRRLKLVALASLGFVTLSLCMPLIAHSRW